MIKLNGWQGEAPASAGLTLRSAGGLVFGAKPFVQAARRYRLDRSTSRTG